MSSRTIMIAMPPADGPRRVPVEAWDCDAGALVVSRAVFHDGRPTRMLYVITHEPTGYRALPLATPRREDAEAAARELAALLDWTAIGEPAPDDPGPGPKYRERRDLMRRLLHDSTQDWYQTNFDPPDGADVERFADGYRFRADGGPWRFHKFLGDAVDAIDAVRKGWATWDQVGVDCPNGAASA